ncbi:hypothetical protein M9H77_03927 [Catharanthus roseus]|uniref:Uncharacterized protein n=1 Tax=Catharanthus roseus TaxID=4058 RepID=A0ACC0CCN1_CATRO|nr:hypothetical protein M9H77_03927 [Catharanthus roseus]
MLGERTRGHHRLIRVTRPRCGIIEIPLCIKSSLNGIRGTGLRDREDRESGSTRQKDLTKRFSQSKHLEGLHKHQKEEKKGKYKFHEIRRNAEEDAEASGIVMPDDLQLLAIVASGVSRGRLYGVGSEAVHFIVESSQAAAGLAPCCLDHEQQLMQRVENPVSRRLFEHNQLTYIPFPPKIPLVRAAMSTNTSTSTSTAEVEATSEVPPRDSSTPRFYSCSQTPLLYSTPWMVLPHPLQMLHRLYFDRRKCRK